MLLNLDYLFTYKFCLRYLITQKLNINKNIYLIPNIQKIIFYFFFNKLENLNDIELYNSFYLFKFFFGRKVFFTKTFSFYSLGKYYYNFNIQLIIYKNLDIYFQLIYLKNNILINIDKNLLIKNLMKKNVININIKNIKVFSETKTNLGLFNLKNSININIYLLGCSKGSNKDIFIKLLKI